MTAAKICRIGGHAIDCILSERATLPSDASEFPVESGGTRSDNVINKPVAVELEFVISDSPTDEIARERSPGGAPSKDLRQALEDLRDSRKPFVYDGPTRTYASMVFTSLEFPTDADTGQALRVAATLAELRPFDVVRTVVRDRADLGHRTTREKAGPQMWLCPDLVVSDSISNNVGKRCRRIELRKAAWNATNGKRATVWYFVDNGQQLTYEDTTRLTRQYAFVQGDRITIPAYGARRGNLIFKQEEYIAPDGSIRARSVTADPMSKWGQEVDRAEFDAYQTGDRTRKITNQISENFSDPVKVPDDWGDVF